MTAANKANTYLCFNGARGCQCVFGGTCDMDRRAEDLAFEAETARRAAARKAEGLARLKHAAGAAMARLAAKTVRS